MLRVGTLLLAGTLAVVSTSGFAADLAYRKAPLPADPAFNWSGFYVGVNAGGGWYDGRGFAGSSNVTSLVPAGSIVSFPPNPARNDPGVTVGGLAGYNYQIGSLVLGAEADFNYADLKSRHSGGVTTICCGGAVDTLSYDSRSQLDWFGTMRARLGFLPTARLLIYATGGLAYGEVERSLQEATVIPAIAVARYWQGSASDVRVGWTAGGGAEYALTSAITVRAEYLYLDLGKSSVTANYVGTFPAAPLQTQIYYASSHDNKFNIARAAIAYKF